MAHSLSRADVWRAIGGASLEWLLTDPSAFGLTSASPLQRAMCRVIEGRPLAELWEHAEVRDALGGKCPEGKPHEVAILSGVRTGKSLLAAAAGVWCSQKVNVARLGPGEVPRVSIVSLTKDLANVVFGHVVGRLQESPLLREIILEEPSADTILVRHPTGRPVEIRVVAGSRAGASLIARWSAGCIFDEFGRMVGDSDGVVNWDHSRDAVLPRCRLIGAPLIHISSPWAPWGPAYKVVQDHFGKPSESMVVFKAPAYAMNPEIWTAAEIEKAKADPNTFRTDVLAEFATPEESLFSAVTLEKCTRSYEHEVAFEGCSYTAAMDPATRGNGWTLLIATRKGGKKVIARALEWRGSKESPLDPRKVMEEISAILVPYRCSAIDTDQHLGDALISMGRELGLTINKLHHTDAQKGEIYSTIKTQLEAGEVELPPNRVLQTDLLRLKRVPLQSGGSKIVLPSTSDGRHCDYAPSFMLAMSRYLNDYADPRLAEDREAKAMRELSTRKYGKHRSSLL